MNCSKGGINTMDDKHFTRIMQAGSAWTEKACFMCGEHFKKGDTIVLVVPPFEYKKEYKRLGLNAVMHQQEWEDLKTTHNSIEEVFKAMGKSKKPKRVNLTDQQKQMVEQFIKAAWEYWYKDYKYNKDGAQAKMNGSSDILRYNVHSDRITYSNRRKRGLFDGLFENQIVANVWNRMHELRGDGKRDDYSADKVINEALGKAKDFMN